tara:strand:+ start:810 stop:1175 length:366 start_codon:yes stop_codon:yes gene_type:complete
MAFTTTTVPTNLGSTLVTNLSASATESEGVFSGQTKSLYLVEIDNTDNSHITYVKLAKDAAVTVGTSDPHFIFPVPASSKITYAIGTGISIPALSFWAVQEAAVGGTTSPTNPVSVKILLT